MTTPIERVLLGEDLDNPVVTINGTYNVEWVYHERERPMVGLRQDLPRLELIKRRVRWAWGKTPFYFSSQTTQEIQQLIGTLPDTWVYFPKEADGSSCQAYVGESDENGPKHMYFTRSRSAISKAAYQDLRWRGCFDKINEAVHSND
jgi:hypothetical protein